jgi:hypothetical protein
MCSIVSQKAHPTPLACVSDHTPNDQDRTMNSHLTLDCTRTFEPNLANVRQLADQMILIHLQHLPYKYLNPSILFHLF